MKQQLNLLSPFHKSIINENMSFWEWMKYEWMGYIRDSHRKTLNFHYKGGQTSLEVEAEPVRVRVSFTYEYMIMAMIFFFLFTSSIHPFHSISIPYAIIYIIEFYAAYIICLYSSLIWREIEGSNALPHLS